MPWPIAWVAETSSITPSGVTVTDTFSSSEPPPVHSRKVAMPRPRSRPRLARLGAAGLEAVPVGQRQALVQHAGELADVVDHAHLVGVGHLLGADHVLAPAQLGRVDACS